MEAIAQPLGAMALLNINYRSYGSVIRSKCSTKNLITKINMHRKLGTKMDKTKKIGNVYGMRKSTKVNNLGEKYEKCENWETWIW